MFAEDRAEEVAEAEEAVARDDHTSGQEQDVDVARQKTDERNRCSISAMPRHAAILLKNMHAVPYKVL